MPWKSVQVCEACWGKRTKRPPFRMVNPEEEPCAVCGQPTTSGIFTRMRIPNPPKPKEDQ